MNRYFPLVAILTLCLVCAALASLHLGLRFYPPATVWDALRGGTDTDALIVRTLRLPRTATAVLVGAALGLAGLLMQNATRNPLAEPGLLGVNAGAGFAVVLLVTLIGTPTMVEICGAALAGAFATIFLIFTLTSMTGVRFDPVSILLAGVTISAGLAAITQVLLLANETALETVLFWLAGSFADRPFAALSLLAPVAFLASICALWLSPALDVLSTDEDSSRGLGVNTTALRAGALALSAILAGSAVAVAGPVAFLGLIAPHIARRLQLSPTTFPTVVLAVLVGALLAVCSDILARIIVAPTEAPISTVTALIGVPFLIALLRRERAAAR